MTTEIDAHVLQELEAYIYEARWFGGKGRDMHVVDVHRFPWLQREPGPEMPHARIELVTVEYAATGSSPSERELYQMPLAYYPAPQERLNHALIGMWHDEELGEVHVYDAMHDRWATHQWLEAFVEEKRTDELVFHRLGDHVLDLEAQSTLFSGEQSNSSVRFGEHSLMKVFRKITPGRNPDVEIHEALTRGESEHIAPLYGWLEAPARGDRDLIHLAMLQQLFRTASDGWDLALASVRDLFAEGDLHADEVGGDFAAESHRLGVATAEVHELLATSFPTHTWGPAELGDLAAAMRRRLEEATAVVAALGPHREELEATFAAVAGIEEPVPVQRIHADFHLGQTLRTTRGWKIVDFEGEPAKPLAERVLPDSRWRDVAGMLRSFDYAAHAVEADVEDVGPQIAYRANEWAERNRLAFLAGYLEAGAGTSDETGSGMTPAEHLLLRAYEADKAVYETVYEARNRPSWIGIPLSAIARLTSIIPEPTSGSDDNQQEASDR